METKGIEMEQRAIEVRKTGSLAEYAMGVQDILKMTALTQQIMAAVMVDGEHFGIIPGTSGKKSLLKPGAEKLSMVFGLSNKFDVTIENLPGGHREYRIICSVFDRAGNPRGQGVGSASTMESKHRYRGAGGKACPSCGAMACKASKREYGGGYYCDPKSGGCNAKYKASTTEAKAMDSLPALKTENLDPADQWNTCFKMAAKRAQVAAILTATAASDCFVQDLDDLEHQIKEGDPETRPADAKAPKTKPEAPKADPQPTTPASSPKEEAPKTNGNGKTPNQAFAAAKKLYDLLPRETRGEIMKRLCSCFGAPDAKSIHPEHLDEFGTTSEALANKLDNESLDAMLADLEAFEKAVATGTGHQG